MRENLKFYIDGQWVIPVGNNIVDVIDPGTDAGHVAIGGGDGRIAKSVSAMARANRE
ncbi:MAG: hypothetical protein V4610_06030 [Pseudomonadota bacterium]|jgi:hypothetical protein